MPLFVIPATIVTSPKTDATVVFAQAGVFVTPVQFTAPIRVLSCVIVLDPASIELASNTDVSCGKGARPVPAVPPEADAHLVTAENKPVEVPAEGTQ